MTTWTITEQDMKGLAMRLDMLSTHYRKPKDFTVDGLNRAAKQLRRWLAKTIPCNDPPPIELLEVLCDDLNTPQAIAVLHRYAQSDGRLLFSGMRLLGLIPGEGVTLNYDIDGMKTIPLDHIPLVQWEGFGTVGATT